MEHLLDVRHLSIYFHFGNRECAVVEDLSFSVAPGEILALVGESGCGKSMSCLALTGLAPAAARTAAVSMRFKDYDLLHLSRAEKSKVRGGEIAYIFQEPSASLNPVFRVGDQIAEAVKLHRPEVADRRRLVVDLLADVGIPEPERRSRAYPHELSGGMQQRVMIALALAGNPSLLIADEPTTALDVTIQAQILDLLTDLARSRGMAVLLVTHNLGIVAQVADRVAVMYAGQLVEYGEKTALLNTPMHPYTQALLQAVPRLNCDCERLATIPGQVPTPEHYPSGCRFATRCPRSRAHGVDACRRCHEERPELATCPTGQAVSCFYAGPEK